MDVPAQGGERFSNFAFAAVLALAALFMCAGWTAHVDDPDAQVYRTLARHLVQDHAWFDLRYSRGVYPHFREHLPFGIWPFALALRVFGERALGPVGGLFTLTMLFCVGRWGRKLGGPWAGELAMLLLALCESFTFYGGRPRLDPLLVLLANLAAFPLLLPEVRRRDWFFGGAMAAGACLVKGPFGLVPVTAAVLARFVATERSARFLAKGFAVGALALLPVLGFLFWDCAFGGGSYWEGYVRNQLLASAVGTRPDGSFNMAFPLWTIAGRFWPGLPFAVFGAVAAVKHSERKSLRLLALFSAFGLIELCLPARKVWNHALVLYPALALLGGVGGAPWIQRFLREGRRMRQAAAGLWLLAAIGALGVLAGGGQRLVPKPCLVSTEFSTALSQLPREADIAVVSAPLNWRLIAQLAAERDLSPWPVQGWSRLASGAPATTGAVLVSLSQLSNADPRVWSIVAEARGWALLRRKDAAVTPAPAGKRRGRLGHTSPKCKFRPAFDPKWRARF
jgi:4-amino-4-deoxy-L-arabinose transferase-like glycosyltransferase